MIFLKPKRFERSALENKLKQTPFDDFRVVFVEHGRSDEVSLSLNHDHYIIAAKITPANVHDTKPVKDMVVESMDKLYADKGYIGKALAGDLLERGVTIVNNVRKNMKAKALSLWDRAMLSRRFIIETIND